MINLIFLTLIVFTLYNITTRNISHFKAFNCGIWGFHGTPSKKSFQWAKFNILGIANDERGGDACGRYSGKIIEHHNDGFNKKYKNYITSFYEPRLSKDTGTIIGHSRKSSFFHGSNNKLALTQPIVRWDEDKDIITNVLVHNGTIYNDEELMLKFDAPKFFSYKYWNENKTDSWYKTEQTNDSNVMADILFNIKDANYDVLKYYQGTASLVWYNKAEDKLYMFAGKSKNYENGHPVEERPLFYLPGEEHLWFSSEEEPLKQIRSRNENEVDEVPKNTLMIFKSGELFESIEIDRTNSSQSSYFDANKKQVKKALESRKKKVGDLVPLKIAGKYENVVLLHEGEDKCPVCEGTGENIFILGVNCYDCKGTGRKQKQFKPSIQKAINFNNSKPKTDADKFPIVEKSLILSENVPDYDSKEIKYYRLRYWDGQNLAHGVYQLTATGAKKESAVREGGEYEITRPYYFIRGIMVKSHTEFNKWSRKIKGTTVDIPEEELEKIVHDTVYPICRMTNEFVVVEDDDDIEKWNLATCKVQPLFSRKVYEFKEGKCENIKSSPYGINAPCHQEVKKNELVNSDGIGVNFEEDEQEIVNAEVITENDSFFETLDPLDGMVRKELSEELAYALKSITEARDNASMYMDNGFGLRTYELLEKFREEIREFGDEINQLPF